LGHTKQNGSDPLQINALIRDAVLLSTGDWKASGELQLDLAEDLPEPLGNEGEINQVLINLIVNAAQAIALRCETDPEIQGLIQIRSFESHGFVVIECEDNGTGITSEDQPHIFEPFFTTKPINHGTGQGLAISHTIVEANHHGRLTVDSSTKQKWTIFRVELPAEGVRTAPPIQEGSG
jgi:signal transduction histidine kinase